MDMSDTNARNALIVSLRRGKRVAEEITRKKGDINSLQNVEPKTSFSRWVRLIIYIALLLFCLLCMTISSPSSDMGVLALICGIFLIVWIIGLLRKIQVTNSKKKRWQYEKDKKQGGIECLIVEYADDIGLISENHRFDPSAYDQAIELLQSGAADNIDSINAIIDNTSDNQGKRRRWPFRSK